MFFNSLQFACFLPVVFLLYWFMPNKSRTSQNYILIFASYYFYSCWDYRFLFLLIFSTLLDYFSAIQIENSTTQKQRKFWLWLCVSINIGFLGIFKYYNFFITKFIIIFVINIFVIIKVSLIITTIGSTHFVHPTIGFLY